MVIPANENSHYHGDRSAGAPLWMTFHSAMGLEFPAATERLMDLLSPGGGAAGAGAEDGELAIVPHEHEHARRR